MLYLAGSLFNWLTALCANLVANRTVRALRVDLFGKLGRLPLQYYDTHSHGDMMSRFTNDIDAISDGLNQGIVQLVSGVMTVLLSLAFMQMCIRDRFSTCLAINSPLKRWNRLLFKSRSSSILRPSNASNLRTRSMLARFSFTRLSFSMCANNSLLY